MRRLKLTELPMSRLALWAGRLGWFSLTVCVLSVIIVRSGILEIKPALATFAAGLACAGLSILLALISFIVIWRQGLRGVGRALSGMFLGLGLLAYPSYLGYLGSKLPMINDITTDPSNPPQFNVLAHLRPRGTNDYPGAKAAALQHTAYPDIAPLQLDVRPQQTYAITLKLIAKRKWYVVDTQPPELQRDGIIEAVARTPIMGLRHDVVVRVSTNKTGSRVDIRSASRFGVSDFGDNAKRISELLADIDDASGSIPEATTEQEKKPPSKR
jgi:uncharacterized protein (DUF1499 family)